jgi:hypothetical protein
LWLLHQYYASLHIVDNKAMVDSINKNRRENYTTKKTLLPDSDIICETASILKMFYKKGIKIKLRHIKGHQDRTTTELTQDAKMNIRADKMATEAIKMKKTILPNLNETRAILKIEEKIVTAKHSKMMQECFQSIRMRSFLLYT